jgi:DNA-binding CsgD family transcriptional regulator
MTALAILNLVGNLVDNLGPVNILTHTGFFIFISLIVLIFDKKFPSVKIILYIEFIIGFLAEVIATPGIGMIMYLISIKLFYGNRNKMIVVIAVIFVSIGMRFYLNDFSIAQIFNSILLHSYLFYRWHSEYNSLLIQKKIKLSDISQLSEVERKIIEYQLSGKTYKEIAYHLDEDIQPSSVRGKAARARKKLGCETTIELIIKLMREGYIDDKWP